MAIAGLSGSKKYRERSKGKAFWFTNNVGDIIVVEHTQAEIITGKKFIESQLQGLNNFCNPCGAVDQIVRDD
jgi:hypothetical protein